MPDGKIKTDIKVVVPQGTVYHGKKTSPSEPKQDPRTLVQIRRAAKQMDGVSPFTRFMAVSDALLKGKNRSNVEVHTARRVISHDSSMQSTGFKTNPVIVATNQVLAVSPRASFGAQLGSRTETSHPTNESAIHHLPEGPTQEKRPVFYATNGIINGDKHPKYEYR